MSFKTNVKTEHKNELNASDSNFLFEIRVPLSGNEGSVPERNK